jgi:DNA-binding XRE family transcriptional regulator
VGRPRKPIDAEQVYKLARLGCTQEEIADIFDVSQQTISDRFSVECSRARASLKMSLRRAQLHRAIKDRSDSMLIHLGKNMLGQSDRLQAEVNATRPIFQAFDDGRDPGLPTPGETA